MEKFEFNKVSEGFKELNREFSPCGRLVMIVGIRENETYTYAVYFWDLSEVEYLGGGYWACCAIGGSFGDLVSAKKEAKQILISRSERNEI